MKRQIKFRAWLSIEKKMILIGDCHNDTAVWIGEGYFDVVDHFSGSPQSLGTNEEGVELMQFTGLKDKNGVEIYEGDILRSHDDGFASSDELFAVKYSGSGFVVYNPNCCDVCKNSFGCIANLDECGAVEVIGNLYQNPELL